MRIDSAIKNAQNNHRDGIKRICWEDAIMLMIPDNQPLYFYDERTDSYVAETGHVPCWNPTSEDLLADDWMSCNISDLNFVKIT